MKNVNLFFVLFFLLFLSANANAQTISGYDYFAGKWNIEVKNAPQGDVKMVVSIEKLNNTISSSIKDTTGKELYKVTSTVITNDQAVINFIGSQGSDVPLTLRKKDENSLTGDIMGMFDIEGKRRK
jgi:hypothetical protein